MLFLVLTLIFLKIYKVLQKLVLSEFMKIRLVGMFLGLNDEQGCKMKSKYKKTSLISLSTWQEGREMQCIFFKYSRILSCDLWSSCFILNINYEWGNERLFYLPVSFYVEAASEYDNVNI